MRIGTGRIGCVQCISNNASLLCRCRRYFVCMVASFQVHAFFFFRFTPFLAFMLIETLLKTTVLKLELEFVLELVPMFLKF